MVAAQTLLQGTSHADASPLEAAVSVWAVFDALETVPAEADDQFAFLDARAMVEDQLEALGLPADRLRVVVDRLLLREACRSRGDPHLGR